MGNFFQDTQGRLHGARIAGVIYAFGLVITFPALLRGTPELAVWACRGCFTLGWALAFCDKEVPRSLLQPFRIRHGIGLLLIVIGLAGQLTTRTPI